MATVAITRRLRNLRAAGRPGRGSTRPQKDGRWRPAISAAAVPGKTVVSKIQSALFLPFFVTLLPCLRQKLVSLKDKIALAWLPLIPAMQDRSGFIQRHLAPLRHPANISMPQSISKACIAHMVGERRCVVIRQIGKTRLASWLFVALILALVSTALHDVL